MVPIRSLTSSSPSSALASTRLFSLSANPLPRRQRLALRTANDRSVLCSGFVSPVIRPLQLRRNFCALSDTTSSAPPSETENEYGSEEEYRSSNEYVEGEEFEGSIGVNGQAPPLVKRKTRRYRKHYPGENKGITEEMRFVAMKLRNSGKSKSENVDSESDVGEGGDDGNGETWQPSIEGFLKYLVDSKLVFTTIERIVDESSNVSYVYFRKTGLERSDCISRDLEWFMEQGIAIPEPSNPGVTYAKYLEDLAEKSPPIFLCHFYNIYFSHIAGGQVIARKVSKMQLDGREMEMFKWEGDEQELLRGVREKLNALGEHWFRDEKNKCLRETTKAFRLLGQILRLIIL